jgi:hypothetical protein
LTLTWSGRIVGLTAMPRVLNETRIRLNLADLEPQTPRIRRLLRQWWVLRWQILEWIYCWLHWWRRLTLSMQPQLQSQWCWAACSASVSSFYNSASTWTQCSVVNAELGQTSCCQDGSTTQCNQPWYLNLALARTGNLASWSGGTASMAQIMSEILHARPVGARIGWADGGGHFVVIAGYLCDSVGYLEVRDPIYGTSDIPLTTFTTSYNGSGSWTHTYYTQA